MGTPFVIYCCHNDDKRQRSTMSVLDAFAEHINAHVKASVSMVDGNACFPDTRLFLHEVIAQSSNNGVCSFDSILNHISKIENYNRIRRSGKTSKLKDSEIPIIEAWKKSNCEDISPSLSGKVVIVSDNSVRVILGHNGAHGVSYGRFAFLIEDYKNILWHEAAHLIGADDHYCKKDVYRAKPKCQNPDLCIMQWNPSDKPCSFCEQSIREIAEYFLK